MAVKGAKKGLDNKESNWLGRTWWMEFNNKNYPTLHHIETGLIAEAMEQLSL